MVINPRTLPASRQQRLEPRLLFNAQAKSRDSPPATVSHIRQTIQSFIWVATLEFLILLRPERADEVMRRCRTVLWYNFRLRSLDYAFE